MKIGISDGNMPSLIYLKIMASIFLPRPLLVSPLPRHPLVFGYPPLFSSTLHFTIPAPSESPCHRFAPLESLCYHSTRVPMPPSCSPSLVLLFSQLHHRAPAIAAIPMALPLLLSPWPRHPCSLAVLMATLSPPS